MLINLTQHESTAAQRAEGVQDVGDRVYVKSLLTFANKPWGTILSLIHI